MCSRGRSENQATQHEVPTRILRSEWCGKLNGISDEQEKDTPKSVALILHYVRNLLFIRVPISRSAAYYAEASLNGEVFELATGSLR